MKKRLVRIAISLFALSVIPALLLIFAFGLPPQYGETFLGALPDKVAYLAQADTGKPRLIIVGGSSVAFGLRSDLLEDEFKTYSVVNMGMYAGLGSTVMLDITAQYLRPGDVVIFSPEQSEQTLSMYFNAEAMWQAADGDWALLSSVLPEFRPALLGQFPYFAAQKARFFLDNNAPSGDGIYARSSFNRWGDIRHGSREMNVMTGSCDPNMPIVFNEGLPTEDFISYLNGYAAMCAEKGAMLYYRFCPMNATAVSETERMKAPVYQDTLANRLSFPILGKVDTAILDATLFYDTNYHLNSTGAIINTIQLAKELKTELGMNPAVAIPMPEVPGIADTASYRGDDSDAGCFTYRSTGNGLQITGILQECTDKTHLILPTQYMGKPVTGFDSSAFAGNQTIETLVLQQNITVIEDGSFCECRSLARLMMQQPSPSQCIVGPGLLNGTNATIYVPMEILGVYKTNYFWSAHASRIHGSTSLAATLEVPKTEAAVKSLTSQRPETQEVAIRYEGNGGTLKSGDGTATTAVYSTSLLRVNTLQGTNVFTRDGYVQVSWNTKADGSGVSVGLGSRTDWLDGLVLYAQWLPETSAQAFSWTVQNGKAWITGYSGDEELCVIPSMLDGVPVRGIRSGAFENAPFKTLVLSPNLYTVEDHAFACCDVEEVYLYDSLYYIFDQSFTQCDALTTLHINAASPPVYSTSYYATFADKYDRLLSINGEKKLVLYSGSSTRFGYDSALLSQAFPAYRVANMGVYAYSNALPQLEIIRRHIAPGDVLLHAPEFDTLHNQFCEQNALDQHFYAMMEANYDMVSELDMRNYSSIFGSFFTYLGIRIDMPKLSYTDSPDHYDDEGNYSMGNTYNVYGDLIVHRPNGNRDTLLQYMRANYTSTPFTQDRLSALNQEYARFLGQGIDVLFTYSPRNRSSLTPESTPEARAELDALLRAELCIPVISDIEESLYSGVYFYQIDSHLSSEGVQIRTERIIQDLRPWLKDQ